MPIDPNIPLGAVARPVEPFNPLITLSQMSQLAAQQQQMELARQQQALRVQEFQSEAQQRAQRGELTQLQLDAARKAQADEDAATKSYEAARTIDPSTGRVTFNRDVLLKDYPAHLIPDLQKHLDEQEHATNQAVITGLAADKAKQDYLVRAGRTLQAAGYNPGMLDTQLRGAVELKALTQDQADELRQLDPAALKQRIDGFVAGGEPPEEFTLGEGQKRFRRTSTGGAVEIASGPPKSDITDAKIFARAWELDQKVKAGTATLAEQQELNTYKDLKSIGAQTTFNLHQAAAATAAGAAANLPAWATDDSRPGRGPEANQVHPVVRMTPNGLYQAAMNYIATGVYPPTGRGTDPVSVAQRTAINGKAGAIAAAAGMDMPALRAFYTANAASLKDQQKMQDAVQGFMATADKNADLLLGTLPKIPDWGSPKFNKPLREFAQEWRGDPTMSDFATKLQSVQNEYARLISQPNLAGQLSDSARHEGAELIKDTATVPQMVASLQALKAEGSNRLISIGEQIQRIQQRMNTGPGNTATGGGGNTTTTTAAAPNVGDIVTVKGQRVRVTKVLPNGKYEGQPVP